MAASYDSQEGRRSTQSDFMEKEYLILVDKHDRVVGKDTKYALHRWSSISDPSKHTLHRAFSIFLFNEKNELLLTQRSKDKLTFPAVWTNSVCSHPLYLEDELAEAALSESSATASGNQLVKDALGVKRAAIRKLGHELGISEKELPTVSQFRFLTRMHYTAPAEGGEWGEDEMDYILFLRHTHPVCNVNREESQDERFVTLPELQRMMADPALKWSPWFAKIVSNFLPQWWAELDAVFTTDKFVQSESIHHL
eukprot:RCo012647